MSITPNPQTWTLRFKNHRTTVFLHVDPLQTISSVKSELLSALQQTDPDGINGKPLPSSLQQIILGKPIDFNDITKGWQRIEEASNGDDEGGQKKGKGRSSKGGVDSVRGVGLRDGIPVAFKWDCSSEHLPGEQESWDVVIPTYDDLYPQDE